MRELTEQERAMRYEPFLDDDLRATFASLLEREAKPTVPEVNPAVAALYRVHRTGGSLHVVLDDNNVGDEHVDFCVTWAEEHDDADGALLARVLRRMSRTQRLKLRAS